jgi:pimeloyl-ACP methyl ester carboxylesterase
MSTTDFRIVPPGYHANECAIAILVVVPDRLEIDGRAIEIRRWAGTISPPIVLLHEGLGSVGLWRDFPAALARHSGRAVFAYSHWGHGASDLPLVPHATTFMHEEALTWLPRVLDAAGIERAVLLGHSDGGSIALVFAATYPSRVEALVLEAPHVFVEERSIASIARMKTQYETTDLRARLGKYHRDVDAAFHGWNDVWLDPEFRAWTLEALLPRVTAPALLIQGEDDEYGTLRQIEAIADQAGGPVEQLILAGCGHSAHRDRPAAVLAAIAAFLARVQPAHSTAG